MHRLQWLSGSAVTRELKRVPGSWKPGLHLDEHLDAKGAWFPGLFEFWLRRDCALRMGNEPWWLELIQASSKRAIADSESAAPPTFFTLDGAALRLVQVLARVKSRPR